MGYGALLREGGYEGWAERECLSHLGNLRGMGMKGTAEPGRGTAVKRPGGAG